MSTPFDPTILTRRCSADASDLAWTLVNASGDDDLALEPSAGTQVIGALTNDVADGSSTAVYLPVQVGGIIKVMCGGTVTSGQFAASDADGNAVNAGTGDYHIGIALGDYVDTEIGAFLWAPGQLD